LDLADKILSKYKKDVTSFELIPSSGGVFEVKMGEKLLFSKKELGRFPEDEEIFNSI